MVLTNKLYTLLQANREPDTEQLMKAFVTYQAEQEERAKFFVDTANMVLDQLTSKTWFGSIQIRFIDPWLRTLLMKNILSGFSAKAPKLDFVPFEDECSGNVPWTYGKETTLHGKSWLQTLSDTFWSIFGFASREKSA